ncbi:Cellulose synthase-like protein E6 [Vitis vinifera]|uniref:Cellulose synthase-like protein E6 n=1 Tax=Vitis vinifera TaxID=29760 RepID=A0A438DE13_VITVI|nr:Cellulose synthase-like protein E6 [Vitis vinifera]
MGEMAKLWILKAFANSSILATLLCKISMIKVQLAGIDSNGGPCYVGTGCFHRRETLCGKIYEGNTQWRKEMGLKYGCPVEDVLRAINTMQSYCPFTYGHKGIPLKLQISYCLFLLWAPNCLSTLYYFAIPSLRLLKAAVHTAWASLFGVVALSWVGGMIKGCGCLKEQTSYFFGFSETILKQLGFSKSSFAVASKVADEEESKKFEKEVMEFGAPSPMFTILATLALLNLFTVVEGIMKVIMDMQAQVIDSLSYCRFFHVGFWFS